jgi:uncharacterized OsmC-like protein
MEITPEHEQAQTFTDVEKSHGGYEIYPTPGGMLAEALAACALTTACMGAEKRGVDTSRFYAVVENIEYDDHNTCVASITIHFHFSSDVEESMRNRLEAYTKRACTVGNSLTVRKDFVYSYDA